MIVVEYPRRLASLVRDSLGPLVKVRLANSISMLMLQADVAHMLAAVLGYTCFT